MSKNTTGAFWLCLGMTLFATPVHSSDLNSVMEWINVVLNPDEDLGERKHALHSLGRSNHAQATSALIEILKDKNETSALRAIAAKYLGKNQSKQATPYLTRTSFSENKIVRVYAKRSLQLLRPSRESSKRFYLNLSKVKSRGAFHSLAKKKLLNSIYSHMETNRQDTATSNTLPLQKNAVSRRRKRLEGYYANIKMDILTENNSTKFKVSLVMATYPQNSIKAFFNAQAEAQAPPSVHVVNLLVNAISKSVYQQIDNFLDGRISL